MGDAENILPPSKKRAAGREITKDNPGLDDEGDSPEETGTFKKASDEVLATRRIVKARRNQSSTATSSNPFAGIRLVAPAEKPPEEKKTDSTEATANSKDDETGKPAEAKIEEPVAEISVEKAVNGENKESNLGSEATESKAVDETEKTVENEKAGSEKPTNGDKVETETKKVDANAEKTVENEEAKSEKPADNDKVKTETKKDDANAENNSMKSFQQLSSTQNAFTGLAGTGFSSATFSFGSGSTDFGLSTNGSSAVFNTTGPSIVPKNEGAVFPSKQDVPVETGEENEKPVFTADSVLFEYINGAWKERGKGELKVKVSTSGPEKARLLMRSRGNFRLILNANLYPDMKLANMDKKGITFACINSVGEGKDGLSTFALKFKDGSIVEGFRAAVNAHKDKLSTTTALKTPENSPKASEE